jgi:hypothetical protein
LYRQGIIGLNDERDVSSVFTAWAPTPNQHFIPTAYHFIVGWKNRPMPWLQVTTEGYVKVLSNLTVFTGNTGFQSADGTVKGLDLRLEITRPFFYGYIGYGLSSVRYGSNLAPSGTFHFRPSHDRRHFLNALGRVVRGPYSLSVQWSYGSGLPFTQVAGFYNELDLSDPNTSYTTTPGETNVLFNDPFQGLLPGYHRLDISFERTITYSRVTGKLQLGVINAYNRNNLFYFDVFSARRIDQLPLIPSIGLKLEVR